MYIVEAFGDISHLRKQQFGGKRSFKSLSSAKWWLKEKIGYPENYPDPEDDRVIIWEAIEGQELKAVWHFSGWHWDYEASDLPGGPLNQGKLPGNNESLYCLATKDY